MFASGGQTYPDPWSLTNLPKLGVNNSFVSLRSQDSTAAWASALHRARASADERPVADPPEAALLARKPAAKQHSPTTPQMARRRRLAFTGEGSGDVKGSPISVSGQEGKWISVSQPFFS
jgi:hypothetical protein